MTTTPNSGAIALVEAARRIVRDNATLPVPGWRLMPETKEKKNE